MVAMSIMEFCHLNTLFLKDNYCFGCFDCGSLCGDEFKACTNVISDLINAHIRSDRM